MTRFFCTENEKPISETFFYQPILDFAIQQVTFAGHLLRERISNPEKIKYKMLQMEVYSEGDYEVECYLRQMIKYNYGTHRIISEGRALCLNKPVVLSDCPTWIMDPVSGSFNFIHNFPEFCTALSFALQKKIQVAAIYNPLHDQLFTAARGRGAYMNGIPINVSGETKLDKAFLSLMPSQMSQDAERHKIQTENLKTLIPLCHGLRDVGSVTLNMLMVARGACDAYANFGAHIWDTAAAGLVILEAGGVLVDPAGAPFDPLSRRIMAASTYELASEICSKLQQYYPQRDGP